MLKQKIPLAFDFIPYPLWRRHVPAPVRWVTRPLFKQFLAAGEDADLPDSLEQMTAFFKRWRLLPDLDHAAILRGLLSDNGSIERAPPLDLIDSTKPNHTAKVRLPAQWEKMESILITWASFYPPLWEAHAQMAEAISQVANVTILITHPLWAQAAHFYLCQRDKANMSRIQFVVLPTDDIWIRDYGPMIGFDARGERIVIDAIYNPLSNYPQEQDDIMPLRWAQWRDLPVRRLDLHMEGGNLWSDGAGTLIMSQEVFERHPQLGRDEVMRRLRYAFKFDKLITTPYLRLEETSHIDLNVKLTDAKTVLVSQVSSPLNRARLDAVATVFENETNAQGDRYDVVRLPMPPLYFNWGVFPIWRSYTNALTVNGRVLVPVFNTPEDEEALAIYRRVMPDYEIIPIDSSKTINGGGAVHCLTREVPYI